MEKSAIKKGKLSEQKLVELYGSDTQKKSYLENQKTITIPKEIYISCLGTLSVSKIGAAVFESLTDCEEIYLPGTLRDISWCF